MSFLRWHDRRRNRRGAGHHRAHGAARLVEGARAPPSRAHRRRRRTRYTRSTRDAAMRRRTLSPERWRFVEPLLDAALDLDAADRNAYVDAVCGSDARLRAEL